MNIAKMTLMIAELALIVAVVTLLVTYSMLLYIKKIKVGTRRNEERKI